jgi:hypothetical protein
MAEDGPRFSVAARLLKAAGVLALLAGIFIGNA